VAVRRLPHRAGLGRVLLVGIGVGIVLGLAGRATDHVPGLIHWAGALGGPWLLGAFAAGALCGGRREGALAGAVAIVAGTAVYYAVFHWVEHATGLRYAAAAGVGWSIAGAVVGGLFGAAGALWREGGTARGVAAGVLAGGLVAESLLLWQVWDGETARSALTIQLGAAALLAVALTGRARLAPITLAVATVSAGALFAGELVVRELLRTSGWAGA
jgi:hypothetical protein